MKTSFINHQGQQLIVYFAGWGTSPSVVSHLSLPASTDLIICYAYDNLNVKSLNKFYTLLQRYQQIHVVAWSLGVWVAERLMQSISLASTTAINGTGLPCHLSQGIPPAIFQTTVKRLSPRSRSLFDQKMQPDQILLRTYQQAFDYRDFDDVRQELIFLAQAIAKNNRTDLISWKKAIIAQNDLIFPLKNMQLYWESRAPIHFIQAPHMPFSRFTHWEEILS